MGNWSWKSEVEMKTCSQPTCFPGQSAVGSSAMPAEDGEWDKTMGGQKEVWRKRSA